MTDRDANTTETLYGAERPKAFIDAGVAIAMTLLILPLMESVTEVAGQGEGALEWLAEHSDQLVAFVLSFVIIAMFWMGHHRLFTKVEKLTPAFLWLTMGWLLSIVWLPVATAMSGAMPSSDLLVRTIYIGSMMLTAALSLCGRLYLGNHPRMHQLSADEYRTGLAMDLAMFILFGLSLLVSVIVPAVSYFSLFLMLLTGPVERVLGRLIGEVRSQN